VKKTINDHKKDDEAQTTFNSFRTLLFILPKIINVYQKMAES